MTRSSRTSSLAACLLILAGAHAVFAQQSFSQRFTQHNASMAALQPALISPLVAPDPRLLQFARVSIANQRTSTGTQTLNFGNGRGIGIIGGNRFEFDFIPPPYIQHNSSAIDGFGDFATQVKYRIASGNAQHGNFAVTAALSHTFATGSHKNGALTDSYAPALVAAKALHPFNVLSSLGGALPTGKIPTQGRCVAWNSVVQTHPIRPLWFELENNASFYFAGSHDGKMQNFLTPASFYVIRSKSWKPTHPVFIVDAGMQIATSRFHTYNHNLVTEFRMLF